MLDKDLVGIKSVTGGSITVRIYNLRNQLSLMELHSKKHSPMLGSNNNLSISKILKSAF
jgi:hypothetical protein